jgi:Right handed beta helix region/Dockerin type I domain
LKPNLLLLVEFGKFTRHAWEVIMWRHYLLTILILLAAATSSALPPFEIPNNENQTVLRMVDEVSYFDANGLLVFATNKGNIGEDFNLSLGQGQPGFYFPYTGNCGDITSGDLKKTVLFSSGIMLGGKVSGEIRTAVSGYGNQEFSPGPAGPDGTALPDIPRFKIYKIDHDSAVWLDPTKPPCAVQDSTLHFNDWQLWKNEAVFDGAPLDISGNPLLLGQQTLWCIYNDGGLHQNYSYGGGTLPLGVEVQQTVWGSELPGEENVIYLKYKLYNRGPNVIDSFYFSYWADPDIGTSTDDLVGNDTTYGLFFAYNGGPYDQYYDDAPAAWGGKVLFGPVIPAPESTAIFDGHPMPGYRNVGMNSFAFYFNGRDPDSPQQLFDFMKGLNATGPGGSYPYYDPNLGFETKFPLAGDPISGTGWNDVSPSDKRLLANFGPFIFNPGDSQQVVLKLAACAEINRLYSLSRLKNILDPNCPIQPADYVAADAAEIWKTDYGRLDTVYFEPSAQRWLTGIDWGGQFFYDGADYGWNFWGGYLDPETMIDSFHTVEIRFSNIAPQRAYRYIRGGVPNFAYGGYEFVPFTVWDVENNRQLNAAFVEWVGSNVFDNTWGPDTSSVGGREYLLILNSDYDGDDPGDAGTGNLHYPTMDFVDGSSFDFLYAGWFRLRPGHSMSELTDGQKMVYKIGQRINPNGLLDSLLFEEINPGDTATQKVAIKCFTGWRSVMDLSVSDPSAFSVSPAHLELGNEESENAAIKYIPSNRGNQEAYLYATDRVSGIIKDQIRLIGRIKAYSGPVWYVATDGNDLTGEGSHALPFATIQHAVNISGNGDTVRVLDGTYSGDGNRDIDLNGKRIVVESINGPYATIIECGGSPSESHRGFYLHSGEDTTTCIRGFTIRNGYYLKGAGIFLSKASARITSCLFEDDFASGAPFSRMGGGIYADSSVLRLSSCTFQGCWADYGAAIHIANTNAIMDNCIITQNTAQWSPAGINAMPLCTLIVSNTVISDNTAQLYSALAGSESAVTFTNCTIAGNLSRTPGNALYLSHMLNRPVLQNSIIAFNRLASAIGPCGDPFPKPNLSCCDIYDNELGDWVDCIADQTGVNGNFGLDPFFCNMSSGNYQLSSNSPCAPGQNACGNLIGTLGVGCDCSGTDISPRPMYAFYASTFDTDYAQIYIFNTVDDRPIEDIDTVSLRVNGSLIPASSKYGPAGECGNALTVSCLLADFVSGYMPLWDTTAQPYTLTGQFKDQSPLSVTGSVNMIGHRSGDVNNDNAVNIKDITYLINFLYRKGPAPVVTGSGDVNGSGATNIQDISILINFIYFDGPRPHCR